MYEEPQKVVDVQKLIDRIIDLPSMPTVVMTALEVINDINSGVPELADVLSKDQAMTSQILKLVNSAYYGFPTQITTINRAIALLGLNKIQSLVLSVATKPMMMSKGGKSRWEHSIRCAVGSEMIAKNLGKADTDEAFIIGLLHDIGKTVIEMYNKEDSNKINALVEGGMDIIAAENKTIGVNHTRIGEALLTKWKLPVVISTSVKYHHQPHISPDRFNTGIVYIADRLTQENLQYPILDPDIMMRLDFDIADPIQLREEIFEASQLILSILSK